MSADEPAKNAVVDIADEEGSNGKGSSAEEPTDVATAPAQANADADSEAETWIESPEKKKNIVDGAPRLTAPTTAVSTGESQEDGADNEAKTRKRKRGREEDGSERALSASRSSHRSSPLSSPVPHASDASDSGASPKAAERSGTGTAHESDHDLSGSLRLRKRRPSDLAPSGGRTIDGTRRETRSATYPRHSSADRSVSPRREHRRVASTQVTRKGRPLNIHTTRNLSSDNRSRSSSSSSSPPRSRPQLHKLTSLDHDTMSPAKATGPRKFRDKNGRTYLSRACNNNDLASARERLAERPQDLNIADNAGNTPLQIAALEGFTDIVEFLLESGCDVDTKNIDKDTPLIDAVENGHIEVVEALLRHGANPRLGNAKGDEPYELVPTDDKNYAALRKLLAEAKESGPQPQRRKSEEHIEVTGHRDDSSHAASAASPRDSPPILGPRSPPANMASRRRTGRSESTRNDLLWQANTQENLAKRAGQGDVQGVASILNILQKAETGSLIAAAKAGHEEVLQLLLAMGSPEPDPEPLKTADLKTGSNTPMLAAIGKGNPGIVRLLVEQSGFDPTRDIRGRTYHEIAADRRGEKWQEEVEILRTAYEKFSSASSKPRKHASPRNSRDVEREKLRRARDSSSPVSLHSRQAVRSPALSHKSLPGKEAKEKLMQQSSREKGQADRATAISSDRDASERRKTHKTRRSQSDLPSLKAETIVGSQKRRRLVTGKEHRRRVSQVSDDSVDDSAPSAVKRENVDKARSRPSRDSEHPDDRSDDVKRESEGQRPVGKKRRIVSSSPEEVRTTPKKRARRLPEETQGMSARLDSKDLHDVDEVFAQHRRRKSLQSNASDLPNRLAEAVPAAKKLTNPSQDELSTAAAVPPGASTTTRLLGKDGVERANVDALPGDAMEDVVPSVVRQPEQQTTSTVVPGSTVAAANADSGDTSSAAAAASKAALIDEAAQRAAEEAAAAERRKADEAAARIKAEEEALARRKEEDERQEKLRRDAEERQRRQEELKRREFQEHERRKREALPKLLCQWASLIDSGSSDVRTPKFLSRFLPLFTVQTRQIVAGCDKDVESEEWLPNFQVAGLLATTKDLRLPQYTSLEKRTVTDQERGCLWKVARNMLSTDYQDNAFNISYDEAVQRELEAKPKFYAMEDLFWVKLTDFNDQVIRHPHLRDINLRRQRISVQPIQQLLRRSPSPFVNGISTHAASPDGPNGIMSNGVMSNGITHPDTHSHQH